VGWAIFKVDDGRGEERFLIWSSVVDAPIGFACTAEEFAAFVVRDAVNQARSDAENMLARARLVGTSSRMVECLWDIACANRAGPGERHISEDEVLEFYVRRKEMPTTETLREYRKTQRG
jgi:hypothetical protein